MPRTIWICAALLLLLSPLLTAGPALGADSGGITADDSRDEYVGSGALILPPSAGAAGRREAADCGDCRWRLTGVCEAGASAPVTADGRAFGAGTGGWCTSVSRGCGDGASLRRPWIQHGTGPWRELGLVCIAAGGPLTRADAERVAAEAIRTGVPALAPAVHPATGALAQLPVLFATGQPAQPLHWRPRIAGHVLELHARPRWTWWFGDGASLTTQDPGGGWPQTSVAHAYRRAADVHVLVRTDWAGEFTVDGLGPYPVREPVGQEAGFALTIGEGRAELTGTVMAQ